MPTLHEAGKPATNLPFDIQLTDLTTQSLAIPTSSTGPTSITGPTSVMPSDATSFLYLFSAKGKGGGDRKLHWRPDRRDKKGHPQHWTR